MSSLIKLKKDQSIVISSEVEEYLNPDFVFLPIKNAEKLKIDQNNDYVFKGQEILNTEHMNVYSSISGKKIGTKKMIDCNNLVINCVVIENDFKERKYKKLSIKKNISNYTSANATLNLKGSGILFDFDIKNLENLNTLVISAVEAEPYIKSEYMILNEHVYEILEVSDALFEIYKIKEIILVVKENDYELIRNLMNHLGMFPKIKLKLVPDLYPIHYNKLLLNYLNIKENVYVLKASKAYLIYQSLKKQAKADSKLITFNGNALTKSKVIRAKIGSEVKNIINEKLEIQEKKYVCLTNGILSKVIVNPQRLVVTDDLTSISLMVKEEKEKKSCFNCGSCVEVCPFSVNPKLVMDTYSSKKKYHTNKENCVNCGLCSYVCPANIDLKKYLQSGDGNE